MAEKSNQSLQSMLANLREALDLEIKQWIDPTKPEGKAKIAKACMAMRNYNGGRLVIGFKNDGKPDLGNAPADVRSTFHGDAVQAIVSHYSSEVFEVTVDFVEVNGQEYVVITTPPGFRTPVAAKRPLTGPDGKVLIRENAIYVRSLNANNIPSSSEVRRDDLEDLTRRCFNNYEADIGGFVRRHLSGLNQEGLSQLVPALVGLTRTPTPIERITEELDLGRSRFNAAAAARPMQIPDIGFREAVMLIEGEFPRQTANSDFRMRIRAHAPTISGWSPWVDMTGADDPLMRPNVVQEGWESLLDRLLPDPYFSPSLDFWRMEPRGSFYHLRALEEDMGAAQGMRPRQQLGFPYQIRMVAEVISVGLSIARALGCVDGKNALVFGFRWTRLSGRLLTAWPDNHRLFRPTARATQDGLTTRVTMPAETSLSAVVPHVENALAPLFNLFEGTAFHTDVYEQLVKSTIGR